MKYETVWGTNIELHAITAYLQLPIYVYTQTSRSMLLEVFQAIVYFNSNQGMLRFPNKSLKAPWNMQKRSLSLWCSNYVWWSSSGLTYTTTKHNVNHALGSYMTTNNETTWLQFTGFTTLVYLCLCVCVCVCVLIVLCSCSTCFCGTSRRKQTIEVIEQPRVTLTKYSSS